MSLPDYPGLKRDISNRLMLVMKGARDQRLGPFNRASQVTYHEGETSDFSTVDGEVKELEMRAVGVDDVITQSDFAHMSHQQILETMVRYGVQFGDQMVQGFLANLNETLEAVGNVVQTKGRPLDADLLLEMYEKIEFSFDRNGYPNLPEHIGGTPEDHETIRRLMTEDGQFKSRFAVLIAQKREAWLARQSNRKLVD